MRRWYYGLAALLSLGLFAAFAPQLLSQPQNDGDPQAPKIAGSKIAKVTVYPGNALVTREVDVPAGAGLAELVVSPMPDQIVPSTMYSEGANGIRVLTTRFRTRQVLEDVSEERRKLEADIEKLQVNATKIASEIAALQKNLELLSKLENFTDKTAVMSTEKGGLNGDTVITMVKYVMDQRVERAKEILALNESARQNNIQLNFHQRKMAELGRGGGRVERDAVIVVDREAGKGGKVRLNYLVNAVHWHPEYKLRAGKVNEDVAIDYLGNLRQQSGEDWTQVDVTLSTAQPMLNAAPPELATLQPVLVARATVGLPPMGGALGDKSEIFAPGDSTKLQESARKLRGDAQVNFDKGAGKDVAVGNGYLNSASALEQQWELMRPRAEILADARRKLSESTRSATNEGPSVTYHLPRKLTIPSRNDEQILEVVKLNLTPKYYYKTVPVLNRHVYRLADLTNKSGHILLPGEATMYQGTDFVGRMAMPLVAVGEEFTAGFGVDPQLQVQRKLMDQTRTTQGGNQVLKYEYQILINSFKSEPVALQVWDRLPHGETETIGISLLKATPEVSKDALYVRESRPNNLLRWDMEVEGNRNGEKAIVISYEFRMELDRQMAITGFQSK